MIGYEFFVSEKLENCKYKYIKAINDYIKQEKSGSVAKLNL